MGNPVPHPPTPRLVLLTAALLAGSAIATLAFVPILKPSSTGAYLFFSGWLLLPHLLMAAAMVVFQRRQRRTGWLCGFVAAIALAGVLLLCDIIFWHPDPQGGIAVVMTPLLQWLALAVALPLAWYLARPNAARPAID